MWCHFPRVTSHRVEPIGGVEAAKRREYLRILTLKGQAPGKEGEKEKSGPAVNRGENLEKWISNLSGVRKLSFHRGGEERPGRKRKGAKNAINRRMKTKS